MIASVAVVAVGAVSCSSTDLDPGHTGVSANQAAGSEPGSDSFGEESGTEPEPVAGDIAQPDTDDAREVDGADGSDADGSDGLDADGLDADGSEDGLSVSAATGPEQFSTGPVLQWTEIDPGFDDLFLLEGVGDGQVIARAWNDGDTDGSFGERVVVSANGTDWTEAPMPEGLFPYQVNVLSDRWVVAAGRDPGVYPTEIGSDRVFFSDDQGATWTEIVIELPSGAASPYAVERLHASPVLVSGQRMVLVLSGYTTIDGQALLEDAGHLPDGKQVVFALPTPDGVSFTLVDADAANPYPSVGSTAFGLASIYGHLDMEEVPEPTIDELELTYDEVGFAAAEMRDLFTPRSAPLTRIFTSDGSTGEVTASYEGWIFSGASTDEGFLLAAAINQAETLLTSPDGLAWSEDPSLGPEHFGRRVSTDGTIWWAAPDADGSFDVQRARVGGTRSTVATFDGFEYPGELLVGPAGLVVVASRDRSRSLRVSRGLPDEGRVARDGFELRYNESEGRLTLWDLTEDTAMYAFGTEEMQSATPPDGVRVIDVGQSSAVVFEDPETGADLVTFTEEDMASLVGMTAAEVRSASSGDPEWPELWLGWSADGTAWGWKRLDDAFGIDDAVIWAEFAVGGDFVIARVATFLPPDPADETSVSPDGQVLPTRWFLAKVP